MYYIYIKYVLQWFLFTHNSCLFLTCTLKFVPFYKKYSNKHLSPIVRVGSDSTRPDSTRQPVIGGLLVGTKKFLSTGRCEWICVIASCAIGTLPSTAPRHIISSPSFLQLLFISFTIILLCSSCANLSFLFSVSASLYIFSSGVSLRPAFG